MHPHPRPDAFLHKCPYLLNAVPWSALSLSAMLHHTECLVCPIVTRSLTPRCAAEGVLHTSVMITHLIHCTTGTLRPSRQPSRGLAA